MGLLPPVARRWVRSDARVRKAGNPFPEAFGPEEATPRLLIEAVRYDPCRGLESRSETNVPEAGVRRLSSWSFGGLKELEGAS